MSVALHMIKVTLDILFNYFGTALRISAGWVALIIALTYSMYFVVPEGINLYRGIYSPKGLLFNAAIIFISIIAFVSCAISWHRFVLLDEEPKGVFSLSSMSLILSYFTKLVLIGFLIVIVAVGSWLVLSYITPIIYGLTGANFLPKLHFAIVYFIVMYCMLRLGLSLPMASLDQAQDTLSKTWDISKTVNQAIIVLSAMFVALWFAVNWLIGQLEQFWSIPDTFAFVSLIAGFVINWFCFIIFIGLLTVLYAKAVEDEKI